MAERAGAIISTVACPRPPRTLRFMFVASLTLPAVLLIAVGWLTARQVTANAQASLEQLSAVAREHALKVVETNALVLDRMEDRIQGLDWPAIAAEGGAIQQHLASLDQRIEQITSLHLIRPDGRLAVISIAWPTPQADLSNRLYFRTLRDQPAEPDPPLVFGPAILGRASGILSFAMARARRTADGAFDGVILGSVMPEYFRQHWQTLNAGSRFTFRLMRLDGLVLAQEPATAALPTEPPAEADVPDALRRIGATQYLMERTEADEQVAYRRIGTHPLAVSVTLRYADVRAEWLQAMGLTALLCLLAAASLGGASLRAIRRWRSEQAVVHRLHQTTGELREEIARREAAEEGLRQSQRLEAVGRLTGGVAHDFNNLLTAILGTLEMVERRLGSAADPQIVRLLEAGRNAVHRGARLTRSLLAFARRQRLDSTSVDINAIIQSFAPIIERAVTDAVTVRLEPGSDLPPCHVDGAQLENTLLNLALNARDAMPCGGTLTLTTGTARLTESQLAGNADAVPGDFVVVTVADSGDGMPAEVRARAFEPFFSTKQVGKGTGLGLSQVFGFIRQSGGHVVLQSAPGHGTTVALFLPVAPAGLHAAAPEHVAPDTPAVAVDSALLWVMLAEDDEPVRDVTAAALRDAGFRVAAAADAKAALDLLRGDAMCDVLVSDIVMPGGMTGTELAHEAQRLRPGLPVLLVTGYAGPLQETQAEDYEVVTKPYDFALLAARIRKLAKASPSKVV